MIQYFKLEDVLSGKEDKEKTEMVLKLSEEKINSLKSIVVSGISQV